MQYTTADNDYRWRFAFLPFWVYSGPTKTLVWWEWYRARNGGDFMDILLTPKEGK